MDKIHNRPFLQFLGFIQKCPISYATSDKRATEKFWRPRNKSVNNEAPLRAKRAENFCRHAISISLKWPKMHYRTFPAVKMITSLQIRGPLENCTLPPLSHYRHPSTRLETSSICNGWENRMSGKIFLNSVLLFGLERLSRSLCQAFLVKWLTVVMDRPFFP